MTFSLKFQDEVLKSLEQLRGSGRFPHALIFEGHEGSGRKTAALFAASMLLCRNWEKAPCGECISCRKSLDNHPDLITVLPENKSKTISVEQIRQMKLSAYISPHESPRKVYFIPDAQRLRVEAQNALLKLIEEPPENAYFILTVLSRSNLLETVVSRSTFISMRELDEEQRVTVLKEKNLGVDDEVLHQQAKNCKTVGEVISALSDPAAIKLTNDSAELLGCILGGERYKMLKLLYGYEKDRESYSRLFKTARTLLINRLCDEDNELSALRVNKIIDIIDNTVFAAQQNAALGLLSCSATNRLISAALSV